MIKEAFCQIKLILVNSLNNNDNTSCKYFVDRFNYLSKRKLLDSFQVGVQDNLKELSQPR